MAHDLLLMLFGGGFTVGVLKFVEFLIQHVSDQRNRKEDKQDLTDKKLDNLRNDMVEHIAKSNATWKENYCDKNAEAINHLVNVTNELKKNVILLTRAQIQNVEEQKKLTEYNKNMGAAINGIIHDRIMHNVECFIERGGITIDEIATLKSMYYPYKKLGGNGDVETAYNNVTQGTIPIITKEEAIKRDTILQRKRIYGQEKTK